MAKEILIADPDKAVQEDFQRIFEATDYQLVFSETGEDALLRAKIFKPDLIIAGTALGEKNGLELCETIKKDPEFKHIPFILISSIFEEIPESDRERVRADGVISKPLHESEVLNLVGHLTEEEAVRGKEEGMSKDTAEWKSFADIRESEEEEIIELVDVVEEPESRISIDDFVAGREMIRSEHWEKLEEEEKTFEKEFAFSPEEKGSETEGMDFQLKKEVSQKEDTSDEELFEKIELEEILKKVEELKPSIEKEWPEEVRRKGAEPIVKYPGFEEFEITSQKKAEAEPIKEEIRPTFLEESEKEVPVGTAPTEMAVEEEELEELSEEEFPEELLEEIIGEEEVAAVEETEEVRPEGMRIEKLEEEKAPKLWEERITPLEKMVDKHLEEVIAKGIQEMVGDFITKLLPEMTQHIIGLTVERIEKMVREIVPDLAEKAIQEEIKRLQQGEKS